MKKILVGTTVAAAILGAAACTYSGDEQTSDPFQEEAPAETESPAQDPGPSPEPPEPVTLEEGDSHEVPLDDYGDSYTIKIDDVRYLESITATEYETSGEFVTAYDGTGYFAVIDMTYTNDESKQQEFAQVFDTYSDLDGNVVVNDESEYTPQDPSGYNIFNAGDVGAEALLMDTVIPAGSSVSASEVVLVPEKSGYVYSYDGSFRLELPAE